MKYLIFDATNLLYRTFFVNKSEDEQTVAGIAHHVALVTANKYFKQFKPNKVVFCFDRHSWRKEYTASAKCISQKPYKGNRRQKMTPAEKAKYEKFLEHLAEFESMLREHTSIITLAGEGLEADDIIAGFVQTVSVMNTDDLLEFVVVSTDKDMIQLLAYDGVRLINPADGKDRTLEDWNGDAELFLFEKCIRGDLSDNVQSALPYCKKTRILKAYGDDFERTNLMMDTWTHIDGREFVVKDLFEENRLLMDLRHQPTEIQKTMVETIIEGLQNPGHYSYFHFMKFLGKYELKKLAKQAEQFTRMLSR